MHLKYTAVPVGIQGTGIPPSTLGGETAHSKGFKQDGLYRFRVGETARCDLSRWFLFSDKREKVWCFEFGVERF